MERLRAASRCVAAVWLVSQLVAIVVSTAILRPTAAAPVVVSAVEHCECTGTEGTCPMHPRAPQPPDGGDCAMRRCSMPDATLAATATVAGVMPRVALPHDAAAPVSLLTPLELPVHRSDRPDFPPPRA